MIQILPCPSCQRSTVLLEGVSLEATIQCPHCEEQFVVGELLTSVFGSWTIINDPALPHISPAESGEEVQAELQLAAPTVKGGKRLSRRARGKVNPNTDWSKFEPISYEEFERLRRQDGSTWRTTLQIGLGGLAAIPISLLLIWHLLGTDVAGAGPLVGQYAPWIVPARFRPAGENTDGEMANAPLPPDPGASGFRQFDEELSSPIGPPITVDDRGSRLSAVLMPDGSGNPDETSSASVAPADAASIAKAGDLAETAIANTPANAPASPPSASPPSASPPSASGKTVPLPSGSPSNRQDRPQAVLESSAESPTSDQANMFAMIRATEQHLETFRSGESTTGDREQLAQTIYSELLQLASKLDAYPKENAVLRTVRDEMQAIGRGIKLQPELQAALAIRTVQWLERQSPASSFPVALVIEIDNVSEANREWSIVPTVDSQPSMGGIPFELAVPRLIAPALMPGQRLLLLGTISTASAAATATGGPAPPAVDEADGGSTSTEPAPSAPRFVADYLHAL